MCIDAFLVYDFLPFDIVYSRSSNVCMCSTLLFAGRSGAEERSKKRNSGNRTTERKKERRRCWRKKWRIDEEEKDGYRIQKELTKAAELSFDGRTWAIWRVLQPERGEAKRKTGKREKRENQVAVRQPSPPPIADVSTNRANQSDRFDQHTYRLSGRAPYLRKKGGARRKKHRGACPCGVPVPWSGSVCRWFRVIHRRLRADEMKGGRKKEKIDRDGKHVKGGTEKPEAVLRRPESPLISRPVFEEKIRRVESGEGWQIFHLGGEAGEMWRRATVSSLSYRCNRMTGHQLSVICKETRQVDARADREWIRKVNFLTYQTFMLLQVTWPGEIIVTMWRYIL